MLAYASIHTSLPASQNEHEAAYEGYHRIPVQCLIGTPFFHLLFPEIEADTDLVMTHVAIGEDSEGNGEIFLTLPVLPHVPLIRMQTGKAPHAIVAYPENLPEYALIAHQLVSLGRMRAEEIEPKLFQKINEQLVASGIPILTCVRTGAAHINAKLSQIPSLKKWHDGEKTN